MSNALGSSKGRSNNSSAVAAAPDRSPPVQVSTLNPIFLASRDNMRPNWPPPRTPTHSSPPLDMIKFLGVEVRLLRSAVFALP